MKNLFVIAVTTCALSACATSPTLQETLADKSKAERVEILKAECLKEAAWRRTSHQYQQSMYHARKLKEICGAMSKEMTSEQDKS